MTTIELELGERFINALKECRVNIDEKYIAKVYSESIELIGSDEKGIRIFGANIDIYNRADFFSEDKTRKFELNTGTLGSFNLDCEASVMKYLSMAELVKNFDLVKAIATKINEAYTFSIED